MWWQATSCTSLLGFSVDSLDPRALPRSPLGAWKLESSPDLPQAPVWGQRCGGRGCGDSCLCGPDSEVRPSRTFGGEPASTRHSPAKPSDARVGGAVPCQPWLTPGNGRLGLKIEAVGGRGECRLSLASFIPESCSDTPRSRCKAWGQGHTPGLAPPSMAPGSCSWRHDRVGAGAPWEGTPGNEGPRRELVAALSSHKARLAHGLP